jgi:chloramphenicol O-acetyltransferase
MRRSDENTNNYVHWKQRNEQNVSTYKKMTLCPYFDRQMTNAAYCCDILIDVTKQLP